MVEKRENQKEKKETKRKESRVEVKSGEDRNRNGERNWGATASWVHRGERQACLGRGCGCEPRNNSVSTKCPGAHRLRAGGPWEVS